MKTVKRRFPHPPLVQWGIIFHMVSIYTGSIARLTPPFRTFRRRVSGTLRRWSTPRHRAFLRRQRRFASLFIVHPLRTAALALVKRLAFLPRFLLFIKVCAAYSLSRSTLGMLCGRTREVLSLGLALAPADPGIAAALSGLAARPSASQSAVASPPSVRAWPMPLATCSPDARTSVFYGQRNHHQRRERAYAHSHR